MNFRAGRVSRILTLLLASLPAIQAEAAVRVVIEGIKGSSLREQLQRATRLYGYRDRPISPAQVRRLHERAPDEIRRAPDGERERGARVVQETE